MPDFFTIILAIIFLIGIVVAYIVGFRYGVFNADRRWQDSLPSHRKDAIMKSRAVLSGQFSEQLSPYLPDFRYAPTECKFMGKPIDFIVFNGMDNKNINEVVFVEVKSGKSKLNSQEKSLKETIEKKKVRWEEYRIPEDLTKNKNNDNDGF